MGSALLFWGAVTVTACTGAAAVVRFFALPQQPDPDGVLLAAKLAYTAAAVAGLAASVVLGIVRRRKRQPAATRRPTSNSKTPRRRDRRFLPLIIFAVATAALGLVAADANWFLPTRTMRSEALVLIRDIGHYAPLAGIVLCLGIVLMMYLGRCKRCGKWAAGDVTSTLQTGSRSYTTTKTVTKTKRDSSGNETTESRRINVRVTETSYRDTLECRFCGHTWTRDRTSRSEQPI